MTRYRLSALAEADLDEIWLHVATDRGAETANRLIDAIVRGLVLLGDHPQAGRLRDDLAENIRSFTVRKHVIYYRIESDRILIARILHGSRDQAAALKAR